MLYWAVCVRALRKSINMPSQSFPTSFALLNDLFPPEQLLQLFKEFFTAIPDKKALSSPKLEVLLSLVGQNFYVHNGTSCV